MQSTETKTNTISGDGFTLQNVSMACQALVGFNGLEAITYDAMFFHHLFGTDVLTDEEKQEVVEELTDLTTTKSSS